MTTQKFIKCFSENKANSLKESGFAFLFEKNGVWYFENNDKLTVKFSDNDLLKDTKITTTVNF